MELPESTQKKSLLLARLLGWRCVYAAESTCAVVQGRTIVGISSAFWYTENGPHIDFYESENMALAWRIMTATIEKDAQIRADFKQWWYRQEMYLNQVAKNSAKIMARQNPATGA